MTKERDKEEKWRGKDRRAIREETEGEKEEKKPEGKKQRNRTEEETD